MTDATREPGWYWARMIVNGPWRPYEWYLSKDGEAMWIGTRLDLPIPVEIGPRIYPPDHERDELVAALQLAEIAIKRNIVTYQDQADLNAVRAALAKATAK